MIEEEERIHRDLWIARPAIVPRRRVEVDVGSGMERDLGEILHSVHTSYCTHKFIPSHGIGIQKANLIKSQGFLEPALNNMATDLAGSQLICVAQSHASVVASPMFMLSSVCRRA